MCRKRKIAVSILMVLLMMLTVIPAAAFAESLEGGNSVATDSTDSEEPTVSDVGTKDKKKDEVVSIEPDGSSSKIKNEKSLLKSGNVSTFSDEENKLVMTVYGTSEKVGSRSLLSLIMYSNNTGITADSIGVTSSDNSVISPDDVSIEDISGVVAYIYITPGGTGNAELIFYDKNDESRKSETIMITVTDGTMSSSSISGKPGDTAQLEFTLNGPDSDPEKTVWSTDDESVADVDSNGLVTFKGNGTCTITATNGQWSGTCTVTSREDGIYIDGKKVDKIEIEMTGNRIEYVNSNGQTYYMDEHVAVTVYKDGRNVTTSYSYYIGNTNVAVKNSGNYYATADPDDTTRVGMINSSGRIQPVANGTTELVIVDLDRTAQTYEVVMTCDIVVTGSDTDAPDPSTNYTQLTDGITYGWSESRLELTLTNIDGIMYDPANQIVHANYLTQEVDSTKDIEFKFTYYNGAGKTTDQSKVDAYKTEERRAAYEESLEKYIKLCDENGDVIADAEDGLVITVDPLYTRGNNGQHSAEASFSVTVDKEKLQSGQSYYLSLDAFLQAPKFDLWTAGGYMAEPVAYYFNTETIPVESIVLSDEDITLKKGEKQELTANVSPENASDRDVTWISSDESVATVDENGVVTAVGEGKAVITASVAEGAIYAECAITVESVTVTDPTDPSDPTEPENPGQEIGEDEDDSSTAVDKTGNTAKEQVDKSAATGDNMNVFVCVAFMLAALVTAAVLASKKAGN